MKIRIYSPFLPFPPSEGGLVHIFNQIDALAQLGHTVEAVCWLNSPSEVKTALAKNASAWHTKVRITCFQEETTLARTAVEWSEATSGQLVAIEPLGYSVWNRSLRVIRSLLSDSASPENYYYPARLDRRRGLPKVDLEIYHYGFSYNWLSRENGGNNAGRTVVFFHNIESDLFGIRAEKETFPPFKFIHNLNRKKLKGHESQVHRFVDEIWQISPKDYEQLKVPADKPHRVVGPVFSKKLLETRRNLYEQFKSNASEAGEIKIRLGFIGGTDFEPNRLSLAWIIKELCPLLSARGFDGEILVTGKQASTQLQNLAAPYEFVKFLGYLSSLEDWWSRLNFMLVPDLTGAGVRIKLVESVASGLPVITHSMATDRCHHLVRESSMVFTRETAEEWADVIMSDKAWDKRSAFSAMEFNKGISGDYIYEFLKEPAFLNPGLE